MATMELNVTYIVIVLLSVLASMTLHEAMHGFMAYWLGDDTAKLNGRLTLNPVKHIDPFLTIILPLLLAVMHLPIFGGAKPVPFNPARVKYNEWGAALVALAGPMTNFLLAFVAFGIFALIQPAENSLARNMLSVFVSVNLGFFAFNMLPLPPLDGSRVLYALAPEFVRRGMEYIERYGVMLVFLIVMVASPMISKLVYAIVQAVIIVFSRIFGIS